MKKVQISDLWVLTLLNEMAAELINHDINCDFYDGYMYKDISWLIKNKNKIVNDFYDNVDKMSKALKTRCNNINRYSKEIIYNAIEHI